MSEQCPECGAKVSYSQAHCARCGHPLGWPNYRKALSEQAELDLRYEQAKQDLESRSLGRFLPEIEKIAEACRPVIGMDVHVCNNLLKGGKYWNYHFRVEIGDREVASETNHGDRLMVNERIYPHYARYLHYGLLSPDGSGLTNYGSVAVSWRVDPHFLLTRATLLEENEFRFFETHKLGVLGTPVPTGYRAIWADRAKLVVAKLAPQLNASLDTAELAGLFMAAGADRPGDVFVEVVIYAEKGIDSQDVVEVMLLKPLTDRRDQRKWAEVREISKRRGISAVAP